MKLFSKSQNTFINIVERKCIQKQLPAEMNNSLKNYKASEAVPKRNPFDKQNLLEIKLESS